MKFFVALFAIVAVAQAGPLPHAVLSAPITQYSSIPAAHVVAQPISWAHQVSAHHVPLVYSAPLVHHAAIDLSHHVDHHSHVVAAPQVLAYSHAAPHVLAHSHVVHAAPSHVVAVAAGPAKYTAATRGAVHEAPLEGHAISQTSLNLAPAPGTL